MFYELMLRWVEFKADVSSRSQNKQKIELAICKFYVRTNNSFGRVLYFSEVINIFNYDDLWLGLSGPHDWTVVETGRVVGLACNHHRFNSSF